jgi:hypothetical protein
MSVNVQAVDEPGPPGLMNRDPNLTAVLLLRLGSLITSRSKLAPSGSSQLIGTETFPHCISGENGMWFVFAPYYNLG